MENDFEKLNFKIFYELPKESWFRIFSYLDLKSFLNLEASSKNFRKIYIDYYMETNTIQEEILNLENKKIQKEVSSNVKISNEKISFPNLFFKDIKTYKKNILKKYCNFLIQIPYDLVEFCGIYSNKSLSYLFDNDIIKINDIKSEINEYFSCSSFVEYNLNYTIYKYKNIIIINNLKFILFYNNTLNVYEINKSNIFSKSFFQYFDEKILFCEVIQNSIILIDDKGSLFSMNINDYSTNIKKIRFYIPDDISQIFYITNYFIFYSKNDNFYYLEFDSIFSGIKSDDELSLIHKKLLNDKFPNQEKSILKLFPNKIKKNYNIILDIISNNNNYLMFIDSNFDIYGLYHKNINKIEEKENIDKKNSNNSKKYYLNNNNNINEEIKELFFYKICKDVKFPNYYTMSFGENYWIILEQNYRLPLYYWTNEEVLKWFEKELGFDDYLKVIKYQNIKGKNILEGDRKYFKDILGMSANKIKLLLNKEIKKVEDGSIIGNSKFYGYGNNKYGQLGLIDIKYTKIPKKLEIPEKEIKNNNDFVIKIICSNTISVLITYKGKIYVCGNFNPKEKNVKLIKNIEDENERNNQKKKKNNHKKRKNSKSEKNKENNEKDEEKNLWVEISYEIIRNYSNNFYIKLKDIYIKENVMYIFGLKVGKKDFI